MFENIPQVVTVSSYVLSPPSFRVPLSRKLIRGEISNIHTHETIGRFKMNVPQDFERRRVAIVSSLSEGVQSGYVELEVSAHVEPKAEMRLDARSFRLLKSMDIKCRTLIASDLRESSIQHLSLSTFSMRVSNTLIELRLDRNKIVDVDANIFESMPNLRVLDLSYNRLTRVCDCLPLRLERLFLSHNRIRSVNSVGHLSNLLELDLSHNAIKTTLQLRSLSLLSTYPLFTHLLTYKLHEYTHTHTHN